MTDRDPRREAASLAREIRRYLERQSPGAAGEMLAASARAARVRTPVTEPVSRPAPEGPAGRPADRVPPRPASGFEAAPPRTAPAVVRDAAIVDPAPGTLVPGLFGEPAPTRRPVLEAPLPPAHAPLAARGLEARAAMVAEGRLILDAIAGEVRACTKCGLCSTRKQAVPGVGSATSGIVFVGEAPGAEEDARGEPFVGRAGELLTRIIKAMDEAKLIPDVPLSRETVYIANVLKCRPPENRNPLPHEIESCSPYLKRQLATLKPRIICCLGKFAAELLVGVKGTIGGLRGRVYRYEGAKLIVTYHPAACLRNPGYKRPVWEDMQLLAREYLTD